MNRRRLHSTFRRNAGQCRIPPWVSMSDSVYYVYSMGLLKVYILT